MKMIYFNSEKIPSTVINRDCIATTSYNNWFNFCDCPCGTSWDIIDGEFTDLRQTQEYQDYVEANRKKEVVCEYNEKFAEFDLTWSAKVARGLSTAGEMNTARARLVTELNNELGGL